MKKAFLFVSAALLAFTFSACHQKDLEAAQSVNDSLQAIIDTKDGEIDALFDMLTQIEDNLALISSKYGAVQELKRNNVEGNVGVKGEINEQIKNIEEMLEANKKKISELNARIGRLGKENTKLQEFVARLEERVAGQEKQISDLMAELASNKVVIEGLNKNVRDLTAANAQKDSTIAQQIADANKAYFIVGNYKDLREMGIVNKNGGFIGIGKRQSTVADMDAANFTLIDRSKVTTITVNTKKAMVVSKHPENSYELVMDENDESIVAYLRILNPAQFWQYTSYLVISTKK